MLFVENVIGWDQIQIFEQCVWAFRCNAMLGKEQEGLQGTTKQMHINTMLIHHYRKQYYVSGRFCSLGAQVEHRHRALCINCFYLFQSFFIWEILAIFCPFLIVWCLCLMVKASSELCHSIHGKFHGFDSLQSLYTKRLNNHINSGVFLICEKR